MIDSFNDADALFLPPGMIDAAKKDGIGPPIFSIPLEISLELQPLILDPDPALYDSHPAYLHAVADTQTTRETLLRVALNPILSAEEEQIGFFKELLEPQVRGSVFSLMKKGYQTRDSGFFGEQGTMQHIEFITDISHLQTLHSQLESEQVTISQTTHGFRISWEVTDIDSLESMTQRWDAIAQVFPDLSDGTDDHPNQNKNSQSDLVYKSREYAKALHPRKTLLLQRSKEEIFDSVHILLDELSVRGYERNYSRIRKLVTNVTAEEPYTDIPHSF